MIFLLFLKKIIADLIRLYVNVTPFKKGQYRLIVMGGKLLANTERVHDITIRHHLSGSTGHIGLRFSEDVGYSELYFLGAVEKGTVNFIERFVQPNDIVFDIGANIGYITLVLALSAVGGKVYSFEPEPDTFRRLDQNIRLNSSLKNIQIYNQALMDQAGLITIHSFPGLHHGLSSISTLGRDDAVPHQVPAIVLDDFIQGEKLKSIEFIKMDVEGAEKKVLIGAEKTLRYFKPTVLLEMNEQTAQANGFICEELLQKLLDFYPYRFFRFPQARGEFTSMKSIHDFENGDNVVAIHPEHIKRLGP